MTVLPAPAPAQLVEVGHRSNMLPTASHHHTGVKEFYKYAVLKIMIALEQSCSGLGCSAALCCSLIGQNITTLLELQPGPGSLQPSPSQLHTDNRAQQPNTYKAAATDSCAGPGVPIFLQNSSSFVCKYSATEQLIYIASQVRPEY